MSIMQKKCRYCRRLFRPDPRVKKDLQKACGQTSCQKMRKKEAQKKWVEENPDYFKGRYLEYTRSWLKEHPDYLKNYRNSHPEYVQKNRIKQRQRRQRQREANKIKCMGIPCEKLGVDIQDTIIPERIVKQ